jgi:hypothetical protein
MVLVSNMDNMKLIDLIGWLKKACTRDSCIFLGDFVDYVPSNALTKTENVFDMELCFDS